MSLKSVKTLTASEIAKKWKLDINKVNSLIDDGAKIEHEHDKSMKNAKEIARDHISERPDYYKKLRKMEKTKISMKEGMSTEPERDSQIIGDLTGSSRKVMKVDEVKLPKVPEKVKSKTKKAIAAGMTAANIATGADIYDRASRGVGSPIRDVAAAASGLPGKVGYGAMGANWTVKGFDKAREHIKSKQRAKMEEQVENMIEDWSDKKHQNPSGGLKKSGVMAYRRENPGSKLQTAVTTKPSKLKPGSKAANRRKSFCARMGGMKKRLTSAKTANDPDSRINKALRKWNCEESVINELRAETLGSYIKKAAKSRKKSLEGPKPDIKTWEKRQHGIGMAIKKLTKEETTMDTKDIINEAIDNILSNDLVTMKENLSSVLQEKAMQRLEEKKKEIASNYFAQ